MHFRFLKSWKIYDTILNLKKINFWGKNCNKLKLKNKKKSMYKNYKQNDCNFTFSIGNMKNSS